MAEHNVRRQPRELYLGDRSHEPCNAARQLTMFSSGSPRNESHALTLTHARDTENWTLVQWNGVCGGRKAARSHPSPRLDR